MHRYQTIQHGGNVRRAKKAGRTPKPPREPLKKLARSLARHHMVGGLKFGPGKRRPGEAGYFRREDIFNLSYLDARHPTWLSKTAKESLSREVGRIAKTPRWTITDETGTTKLGKAFRGGGVGAVWSPRKTCPTSCPIYNKCYASEAQSKAVWQKLSRGYTGYDWNTFLEKLRSSKAALIRVNVAGDLPGDGHRVIDRKMLLQLAAAAAAKKRVAYTYTHYPPTEHNISAIKAAIKRGLMVNFSADSLADADRKAATGIDVAVVLPSDAPRTLATPAGRPIIGCPQIISTRWLKENKGRLVAEGTYESALGKRISCASCGGKSGPICAVGGEKRKGVVVGFHAHGALHGKKKDADVLKAMLTTPSCSVVPRSEVAAAAARAKGEIAESAPARPAFSGRSLTVMPNPRRRRRR